MIRAVALLVALLTGLAGPSGTEPRQTRPLSSPPER
jgi:hypothetical protein